MSMTIAPLAPRAYPHPSAEAPQPRQEAPGVPHAAAAPGHRRQASETLTAMAKQHGAGQAVGQASPPERPQTPLDAKVQATDQAVASFTQAQNAYRAVAARPDANPDLVTTLRADADRAQAQLRHTTGEELELRASLMPANAGAPAEAHYRQAGQDILRRYEGQPAQKQLLQDTLGDLDQQRETAALQALAEKSLGADRVSQRDDTVTIETGARNDQIKVSQSKDTGDVTVSVNGRNYQYRQSQARHLEIRTHDGNDLIQLDTGTDIQTTIHGGDGDDRITAGNGRDTVYGGAGHDYIDGGDGNDTLLGQDGSDTLYGGLGGDTLDGGQGDDYLDGYLGNDHLSGGADHDVLSGGQGDDRLDGNTGNDVMYAGKGSDQITDLAGNNNTYHQGDDKVLTSGKNTKVQVMEVPSNITITGTDAFKARTQADLETLAASPAGQQMLKTIEQEGRGLLGTGLFGDKLNIVELADENGYYDPDRKEVASNPAFHLGRSPEDIYGRVPPIVVLYHELGHAQADMNGTKVSYDRLFRDNTNPQDPDHNKMLDEERRNVGLPRDHDHNPDTPAQMDARTPYALTENGLREEMGYRKRGSYAMP